MWCGIDEKCPAALQEDDSEYMRKKKMNQTTYNSVKQRFILADSLACSSTTLGFNQSTPGRTYTADVFNISEKLLQNNQPKLSTLTTLTYCKLWTDVCEDQ